MASSADSITARSRLCVLRHWLHGVALWCAVAIAQAAGIDQQFPAARQFFPQADRFDQPSGDPPAAGAYRDGALLGYVFVTTDIVKIPGYSGRPINLLVGLDVSGKITGVSVLEHEETILRSHFPKGTLERFVESYVGKSITQRVGLGVSNRPGYVNIDAVSGATVTLMAVNRTILDAARKVDGWTSREDMELWFDYSLALLRDMAVLKITGNAASLINPERLEQLAKLNKSADVKVIIYLHKELNRLRSLLIYNLNKSVTWNYTASLLRKELSAGNV